MKFSPLFTSLFLISLVSCDLSKRIDTAAVVKELKAKQVKRLLPQQIVSQVDTWGESAQKELNIALATGKPPTDSLRSKYQISIQIGDPKILKNEVSDPKLKEVLDALDYSISIHQDVTASIQKNTRGDSLFYIYVHPKFKTIILGFSKIVVIQNMDRPLIK